jgi:predicted Zn-dependent protease
LPGGFIYINKGLLDILNDDELAFVLGHELGHVAARHAVKKIQANMAYQMLAGIAFSGMENKAGGLVTLAKSANVAYNLIELGYSRDDEYQSDYLGVKYAFKAGFNPNAALTSLEKLKNNQESKSQLLVYLRTHPYVDDRINSLKKIIPGL